MVRIYKDISDELETPWLRHFFAEAATATGTHHALIRADNAATSFSDISAPASRP
jgi:hypothetical protein